MTTKERTSTGDISRIHIDRREHQNDSQILLWSHLYDSLFSVSVIL